MRSLGSAEKQEPGGQRGRAPEGLRADGRRFQKDLAGRGEDRETGPLEDRSAGQSKVQRSLKT